MNQYSKIIFPTDFSECANEAYEYALLIASMYKSELHIFHAFSTYSKSFGPEYSIPDTLEINSPYPAELKEYMDKYDAKYGIAENKIIKKYKAGYATAPTIIEYIKNNNIDLIVMGTHGRRGLRHMLLGSVTEEVLRKSKCNVLTVKKNDSKIQSIKHILIPTDFSKHAKNALIEGLQLVNMFEAKITLLHVIEEPIPPAYYLPANNITIETHLTAAKKNSLNHLSELVQDINKSESANIDVIEGHVASSIKNYADNHEVDLIVMGAHGYTGLKHFLLGSTTEKMVRIASCPILIVK